MADDEQIEPQAPPGDPDEPQGQDDPQQGSHETPVPERPAPAPLETPPEPVLAEPGVYVCIAENVGEHPQLGVLTFGEEYDYSQASAETLEAVAACVEGGYLEKVDSPAGETETPAESGEQDKAEHGG